MTEPTDIAHDAAVVIFCRGAEREARCKRLGLPADDARHLCRALLYRTLDVVGALPAAVPVVLLTEAPLAPQESGRLGRRRQVVLTQRGATFEDRLVDGLQRAAARGFTRLVVVGADTPDLRRADLEAALAAPRGATVAGPAPDGGIYLLAIDADHIEGLRHLPWCTATLGRALQRRLGARQLSCRRRDVDDAADVATQRSRLERLCSRLLGRSLSDGAGDVLDPTIPAGLSCRFGLPVGRAPPTLQRAA